MVKEKKLSSSSVLSASRKLCDLLAHKEKLKFYINFSLSFVVSLMEIVTVVFLGLFAQVLNDPSVVKRYAIHFGLGWDLSPGQSILYVAIAVGAVYLVKNTIAAVQVVVQNFSIQKACYDFKNKLLYRYAHADYGFYLTRNSYFGVQVVDGDVEQTFTRGMGALLIILSESIVFVSLIGVVIYLNPPLAFFIFGLGIMLSFLISKFLLPQLYRFGEQLRQIQVDAGRNLMQFFHAFKEIILLGKRASFVEAYQVHSRRKAKIQAVQMTADALPRIVIEVLFVGIFILTICYLCVKHENPMQMMGLLSGYLYVGFRLMPGLNRIITQLNIFKSSIPFIERTHKEYLTIASDENYLDIPSLKFNQSISFENVCFKYINAIDNSLSYINLKIKKGECIGIVGETGSGKSTLVDLILGMLRPSEGRVLVDDQYPANATQWHQKVGYVPQAVYLIDDTIEANIAFGEDIIDKDKLHRAIDAAQLTKMIHSLPKGLKTIVGDRGVLLSGGERQRIAIARALYRDPEVLIFDEATSALDNETEARLMETINSVSKNRTVIMIAHRLTTLKNCDRIIQMDKKMIKSITTYAELSSSQNLISERRQYVEA